MTEINTLKREYEKRSEVVKSSLRIQDLTQKQYDSGYVDYFSVSDAQRLALTNERAQLSLLGSRYRACVNLIAALGGGWTANIEEQRKALEPDLLDPYELKRK